jgi:hypothetical protein
MRSEAHYELDNLSLIAPFGCLQLCVGYRGPSAQRLWVHGLTKPHRHMHRVSRFLP